MTQRLSVLENVPCALEKTCIQLISNGMSYKYISFLSDLMCHLKLVFPY